MKREESPEPLSNDARLLLRGGRAPRARTAGERARTEKRIVKLGAMPVVASAAWLVWAKGAALAAGLTLAAGTVVAIKTRYAKPDAPAAPSATARGHRSGLRAVRVREPAPAPAASVAPVVVVPEVAPSVVFVQPSAQPSAPAVVPVRRPVLVATRAPAPAPTPEPSVAVIAAAAPAPIVEPQPSAPLAPPPPVEPVARWTYRQEIALTQEANELLRTSPQRALELIEQHRREFGPDARMTHTDREFVVVQALLRLGRTEEARTRGAALIANNPRDPAAVRTQRSLAEAGLAP